MSRSRAAELRAVLDARGMAPGRVVPLPDGGDAYYFFGDPAALGGRYAAIECDDEGGAVLLLVDPAAGTDEGTLVTGMSEAVDRARAFVARG